MTLPRSRTVIGMALAAALLPGAASAAGPDGFLGSLHRQSTLTSTVPDNGDQNPYAIVVAPVSAGTIQKGDVLIGNFNNGGNLQGAGTTIVAYHPDTKKMTLFASMPRTLAGCPGGIGLGTAMTMLSSGWVIIGSAPSVDGTTATKGAGCLIVLGPDGKVAKTLVGPDIDMPWGNMAVIDRGSTATLFISMAGFGIGAPQDESPVVNQATVLRMELAIPQGQAPSVTSRVVVADGLGSQADKGVFLIGPTGLALGADDTLYVSDAVGNRVVTIDHASTRTGSGGTGRELTKDGLLQRPLALAMAPNGHLLTTNGLNGQVVEIDPASGKQLYARWIDTDRAQSPPGSGDLFGLAMTPGGDGFYFVQDDMNTVVLVK